MLSCRQVLRHAKNYVAAQCAVWRDFGDVGGGVERERCVLKVLQANWNLSDLFCSSTGSGAGYGRECDGAGSGGGG